MVFFASPFGSYYIIALETQRNHFKNAEATVKDFIDDANCRGIKVRNHSSTTGPVRLDEKGCLLPIPISYWNQP
jgi:hypothetical protein